MKNKKHALLTSDNIVDLVHALKNGYWDHSSMLNQLDPGSTVLIKANKAQIKLYPGAAKLVLKAVVESITKVGTSNNKKDWQPTDKDYNCRLKFVPHTIGYTDLFDPMVIKASEEGRVNPQGIQYFSF